MKKNRKLFRVGTILIVLLWLTTSYDLYSQIQTSVIRNLSTNTDYNQLIRNGVGATLYINQVSPEFPILSLGGGSASAGQGTVFTVSGKGNVGIGTTATTALLNVGSKVSDNISSLKFGVAGDMGNIAVPLGASSGGYNIDFAGWRDVVPDHIGARIRAERVNTFRDNNALAQGTDLVFYSGASGGIGERIRIRYDGNVGIGTNNPTSKLAVNGLVKAKEVNVTINGSDWPDYIFKESYNLISLDSLSRDIHRLGHLPNIPSAQEVKENGVDLGEINRKLLENVEMLTLYLIDLKKDNEALHKRLSYLEQTKDKDNTIKFSK